MKLFALFAVYIALDSCLTATGFNVNTLTPQDVTVPLTWLRKYGMDKRDSLGKKGLKQYLAVMVISSTELKSKGDAWKKVADDLKKHEDEDGCKKRLKFFENKQNNVEHGEKQLVASACLNDMVGACRTEKKCTTDAIAVLYTFYIPCSNIYSISYQCSEILMQWNTENANVDMVLGYDKIFTDPRGGETNEARSKWFMEMGGIAYFHYDEKATAFVKPVIFKPSDDANTVQNWIYQCLVGIHLKTDFGPDDVNYRDEMIDHHINCVTGPEKRIMFSYFVNYLMYLCTKNPMLRPDNKDHFRECFKREIENKITTGCPRGGVVASKIKMNTQQIRLCSLLAVDKAKYLASPTRMVTYQNQVQLSRVWTKLGKYEGGALANHYKAWRPDWTWEDANINPAQRVECANSGEDLKRFCSKPPKVAGKKRKGGPDTGPAKKIKKTT